MKTQTLSSTMRWTPLVGLVSLLLACGSSSGGSEDTGGVTPCANGTCPTGGAALGSGGASVSGGAAAGGTTAAGGGAATGGASGVECTNLRPTGTDWDAATCDDWASATSECSAAWMIDNHWCDQSCGRCTAGGSGGAAGTGGAASGGAPATGGGTGVPPSSCTEADAEVCSSYKVGQHCGLTYEIWTDTGTSCMTNTSSGFKAYWDTGDGNYLARKGVRPGSSAPVVTYEANYQPSGNSYLAIYGWTQNPLIEYYIVDSWGSWRPPGTTAIGTVDVDGGTYEIYRSERVDKPSIEGNKTFWQYWSVRKEKRTSGTITVKPHFDAWSKFGLTLGTFYEVSMVVEGYNSSGTADVTVSFK